MIQKKIEIEDKIAVLIIVIASFLRFFNYSDWSLSNDELSAMARLQFSSFSEMIEKGVRTNDMHPIGVQSFLWFWTHLTGISEKAFRLPFVLFGIGSVIVFYKIASQWFNKTAALFSLCFFSILQFPILYSQLARPYSPGLFFSLLFVLAWSKIIIENKSISIIDKSKIKWFSIFIISGMSCMYIHYFSFLFAGIVGVAGFAFINKKDIKWYLLASVLMFIFYLPNLNVFIYQFSVGGLGGDGGWLSAPKKTALLEYCFYALNDSYLVVGLSILILMVSAIINWKKIKWTKFHTLSLLFFSIPALIAYFYSILNNPVFQYSILLFSFPFLLLLISSFIPFSEMNFKMIFLLVFTVGILLYSTVIENNFYSKQNFANFKGVASRTIEINNTFGSENILNTMNVISPFYIDYYLNKSNVNIDMYRCEVNTDFNTLNRILSNSNKNYFLFGWANTFHAPEIDFIVRKYYPYLVEVDSFFNSGLTLYSKINNKERSFKSTLLFSEKNSFEIPKWNNDSILRNGEVAHDGLYSSRFNENFEYGSTFSKKISDIHFQKNTTLQISCFVKGNVANASIVFSVDREGSSYIWRSVEIQPYINDVDSWNEAFMAYTLSEELLPNDELKVYVWNPSKKSFWIDDINIQVIK